MNWFILLGGVLWLLGAMQAYYQGNHKMMVVSLAYSVAQFVLAGAK